MVTSSPGGIIRLALFLRMMLEKKYVPSVSVTVPLLTKALVTGSKA